MTFLNPMMLFGLAAVAVPIIIHLLHRRKFQRVVWAAMRFLKASVEQNQRRMRIEDIILLVLRCLLVVLIALALARPALLSEAAGFFGTSKVTGGVVLDNSYSMGMSDGTLTRFEKAKQVADQAIQTMPPGSAAAVFLASDVVQAVIPEPTHDLNLARKTVREARLTDRPTDLFDAVDRAVKTLRGRLAVRKELYLITDGQALGWSRLREMLELLEQNRHEIGTHIVLVGEHEPHNLGVSDFRLASGLAAVRYPLRFEVRVANHGREEVRDVRVTLSVDDQAPSDEMTIDRLAPGASRSVSLFGRLDTPGFHTVTARLPQDRLPADDRRDLVVRAWKELRVLLVDGDPRGEPREHESFFLKNALVPVAPAQAAEYFIKVKVVPDTGLPAQRLDDYDVVILANVARLAEATVRGLQQYLRRGGGLMIFPGDKVNATLYNEQLYQRGRVLPSPLLAPRGDAGQDERWFSFQARGYEHPITELWNDPAAGTLSSVRTFRAFTLQAPALEPEAEKPADAEEAGLPRVVLRYEDGTPAVMERSWGLGRVVLFSSTADTAWNDWPVRVSFVPMIHRTLGALIQMRDEGLNIRVGEPFRRRVGPEYLGRDATFSKPGQTEAMRDLRRIESVDGWPTLQYDRTDWAGVYEAHVPDPLLTLKFAAQADPVESSLEELAPSQIARLRSVAAVYEWKPGFSLKSLVTQQRRGAEFWLPLAVAAVLVGLVETFLGQWFSRSK